MPAEQFLMTDIFTRAEFDAWAETYDTSISIDQFPFLGYQELLVKLDTLVRAQAGMSVLDLGTGTGNLAVRFADQGCEVWCTDFSVSMLARARQKLPNAHFCLHDLRSELPAGWRGPFDRIVSTYVFHHFELNEKIRILRDLRQRLAPGGSIVIGDIAFQDQAALEKVKVEAGGDWEDEFYWLANEAVPALRKAGMKTSYRQISPCAGVFVISV